jgi:hypothetical protein
MGAVSVEQLKPGTVLRVRSTRMPAVMHWGVVGYGSDFRGYPLVWHSQKSDSLRCTEFEEFSSGQSCEIVQTLDAYQAMRVIRRLESKRGLPWHLTQANCEMVVRWAVEDKAVSGQLAIGVLAALFLVVVAVGAAS